MSLPLRPDDHESLDDLMDRIERARASTLIEPGRVRLVSHTCFDSVSTVLFADGYPLGFFMHSYN